MCSSKISRGTFRTLSFLSLEKSQFWFHGGCPAHDTARAAWKCGQLCQESKSHLCLVCYLVLKPPVNREESAQMCLDFLGFASSYSWFIPTLTPDHIVPDDLVHSLILSHTLKNCNFTSSPKDAPCSWLNSEAAPKRHPSDSSTLCSSPTSDHTLLTKVLQWVIDDIGASLVLIVQVALWLAGCCSGCVLAESLAGIAGIRETSHALECIEIIELASKMHFEGLCFFHCYLGSLLVYFFFLDALFFSCLNRVFLPQRGGCGRPSPQPLKSSNSSTSMELGTETQGSQLQRRFRNDIWWCLDIGKNRGRFGDIWCQDYQHFQTCFMTQAMTSKRCASIAVPKQLHSDSAAARTRKSHTDSTFRAVGKARIYWIYCKCM